MTRKEFTVATKKAAEKRADGYCEGCGQPFTAANPPEYDHDLSDGLESEHISYAINSLENCKVLGAKCCHSKKTHEVDRPMMAKADRLRKKRLNQTPAKRKWPSKKFNGQIQWNR